MLVIIDSGGANISSIKFAFHRLGCDTCLTNNIELIKKADKIVLPGVGSAGSAMQMLRKRNLINCIKELSQPVLGICLGMQLLFESTEEGNIQCLGIIPGKIEAIPYRPGFSIPHIGWNEVRKLKPAETLLRNINDGDYCYFVHSYYATGSEYTIASTDYSVDISAIVKKDNFYGCQFHPEKSSNVGATILKNFLEL